MASLVKVKPVVGLHPTDVVKSLRQQIKNMYMAVNSGDVGSGGMKDSYIPKWDAARQKRENDAVQAREAIWILMDELREAAPRRKPNEIRDIITRLNVRFMALDSALMYERQYARDIAARAMKLIHPGTYDHDWMIASLEKAYSYVQAIPTVSGAPIGNTENTIRAIAAIVKAHYGLLESDVKPVPNEGVMEEMTAVLLQVVQEAKQDSPPKPEPSDGADYAIDGGDPGQQVGFNAINVSEEEFDADDYEDEDEA